MSPSTAPGVELGVAVAMTTTDAVVSPTPGCVEMPCFSGGTVIRHDVASGGNAVVIRDVPVDCIAVGVPR